MLSHINSIDKYLHIFGIKFIDLIVENCTEKPVPEDWNISRLPSFPLGLLVIMNTLQIWLE